MPFPRLRKQGRICLPLVPRPVRKSWAACPGRVVTSTPRLQRTAPSSHAGPDVENCLFRLPPHPPEPYKPGRWSTRSPPRLRCFVALEQRDVNTPPPHHSSEWNPSSSVSLKGDPPLLCRVRPLALFVQPIRQGLIEDDRV